MISISYRILSMIYNKNVFRVLGNLCTRIQKLQINTILLHPQWHELLMNTA